MTRLPCTAKPPAPTTSTRLYNLDGALNFYNETTGPGGAFSPNVNVHLTLTRNSATGQVVGYVNGVQHISFTDGGGQGSFTGPNNIIHLFRDDNAVPGEASAGFADYVKIYDGALTAAEVLNEYNSLDPVPAPPAVVLAVVGFGVAALGRRLRRK